MDQMGYSADDDDGPSASPILDATSIRVMRISGREVGTSGLSLTGLWHFAGDRTIRHPRLADIAGVGVEAERD